MEKTKTVSSRVLSMHSTYQERCLLIASMAWFAPVQENMSEKILGIHLTHLTQTQVSLHQVHQENALDFHAVAPLIVL